MMFEVGKTYKTRAGRDAKLLHRYTDGREHPLLWTDDDYHFKTQESGSFTSGDHDCEYDILPPVKVAYVNIYGDCHASRAAADSWSFPGRTACVRVEYYEGQFDD